MAHFNIYKADNVYSLKTHKRTNWSIHIELFGWRLYQQLHFEKLSPPVRVEGHGKAFRILQ